MVDFPNSKNSLAGSWRGKGVIPRLFPVRATPDLNDYESPFNGEDPGSASVWWEVIDWPYAADSAGIAFDQANLYGVRALCWRRPLADGGGDLYRLTPVPKTLPVGYTASVRKDFDYNPFETSIRTAGGYETVSIPVADGWLPQGLDDTFDTSLSGGVSMSSVIDYLTTTGTIYADHGYTLGAFPSPGWRGGNWEFTVGWGSATGAQVNAELIIAADADPANPWDPYTGANLPTVLETIARSSNPDGTGILHTGTFGAISAPTFGKPTAFYLILSSNEGSSNNAVFFADMGFRTDIPLCATATYKNKVAPGGYAP